ncbi:MAG: ferritin family protein [Deltaproteobacteria bacterium]|nr:ferritin family protein [Deltaproteobacteria bacterium]
MPDNKIIEELGLAYKTEVAGYFFYNTAAIMVGDDKGKNIFNHLAKEELDHIRIISRIADSVKSGMGWVGYEEALKEGVATSKGLPIFHGENELVKRLERDQTDTNAVNIAIENEEGAVEFYTRLLKDARTPVEKVVITNLLEMEKGHLKILRWESESLQKTGFWCGDMEYSVEKEQD